MSEGHVSRIGLALVSALMVLTVALACAARAGEPPDNIAEAIADAAEACKNFDGVPDTADVLTIDDVNRDGGEDWVADYAKLKCEGGINPMCDANGCVLQIYLWNGGRHGNSPSRKR